ncbi:hypothetical protein [Paradevosia shaoguanensis]|uniref:hypothetical protein n=1 Tax=Paradevosia shaoguanensis TaxID=1335043 RepID=UPI003C75E035
MTNPPIVNALNYASCRSYDLARLAQSLFALRNTFDMAARFAQGIEPKERPFAGPIQTWLETRQDEIDHQILTIGQHLHGRLADGDDEEEMRDVEIVGGLCDAIYGKGWRVLREYCGKRIVL